MYRRVSVLSHAGAGMCTSLTHTLAHDMNCRLSFESRKRTRKALRPLYYHFFCLPQVAGCASLRYVLRVSGAHVSSVAKH